MEALPMKMKPRGGRLVRKGDVETSDPKNSC
jgi:hypothetical protein